MTSKKTENLETKNKRIKEIADKLRSGNVEIDQLIPLVDEALDNYNYLKERLDNQLKALDEREKSIKSE